MCEHIVNRMSDVGVANLATRQPPVSTAPGRGGSKPPAAAQPLNIQRTAQLRQLREAKSLPYMAWAYELPDHPLQIVCSYNGRGELTKRLKTAVFSGMIALNIFRRNTAW